MVGLAVFALVVRSQNGGPAKAGGASNDNLWATPTSNPAIPDLPKPDPVDNTYSGFTPGSLMTPTEEEFFRVLLLAAQADYLLVFTKPRIADFVATKSRSNFCRISQKHADFILCDRGTLELKLSLQSNSMTEVTYKKGAAIKKRAPHSQGNFLRRERSTRVLLSISPLGFLNLHFTLHLL